ncbi:hypothetical protein J4Q44_G00209720 [Coregonus suidteri]|uniref:Uncharacterized protein n=1 Tax=Coregonus suidteri TaxID=861788 RepID=A0AAN8QQ35_9TELE
MVPPSLLPAAVRIVKDMGISTTFFDGQQPLEGIPDDDHLDNSDGRPLISSFEADDQHSLEGIRQDKGVPSTQKEILCH